MDTVAVAATATVMVQSTICTKQTASAPVSWKVKVITMQLTLRATTMRELPILFHYLSLSFYYRDCPYQCSCASFRQYHIKFHCRHHDGTWLPATCSSA